MSKTRQTNMVGNYCFTKSRMKHETSYFKQWQTTQASENRGHGHAGIMEI